MLKHVITICCLLLSPVPSGGEPDWETVKSRHFIVHHRDSEALARRVGRRAEQDYERITAMLGFTRHGDFWLWENRVDIFIYPSAKAFADATGAPRWAAGAANYRDVTLSTYRGSPRFLDSLLPHELAHLIFREFLDFEVEPPLWLNEGIAQGAEREQRRQSLEWVRRMAREGRLIPLERLTRENLRTLQHGGAVMLFYAQSVSLVDFLIEEYGSRRFRAFCGHIRDGKDVDAALRFTYPDQLHNMNALESEWKSYLIKENPE